MCVCVCVCLHLPDRFVCLCMNADEWHDCLFTRLMCIHVTHSIIHHGSLPGVAV